MMQRDPTQQNKNSINSRGGAGVVAVPATSARWRCREFAKPAEAVRNGGKVQTADAGNGAGVRGGSGSGGVTAVDESELDLYRPMFSLFSNALLSDTNPAFSSSSNQLDGAAVVGSTTSLFRNSSLLRPVSYTASLESIKTVSARHPDALLPSQTTQSGCLTLSSNPSSSSNSKPQQHQKRLSYAEQRAKTGSSVELVSGQVFASSPVSYSATSSSSSGQDRSLPRQSAAMVRVLPTQIEEELLAERSTRHRRRHRRLCKLARAFLRQQLDPVPPRHRGLNRVNLGGEEDGRSVTSTVLKQEALQAFEFLDTLE
uniref:BHLH domain-containing protein n=1 Tax=Macrostomum lignano TaxID=282301 RepID=A0A1I8F366_9PLAT